MRRRALPEDKDAILVFEQDARTVSKVSVRAFGQDVDFGPREGLGRAIHAVVHGLTMSTPMSSKSRTLRVATVMPRERAIAAI